MHRDLWKCECGRLFAQPTVSQCKYDIRGFGEGEGVEVSDVTIYLKEVIITLI